MRQVIASTQEEIIREINLLVIGQIPLLFCQKGAPHSSVFVKAVDSSKAQVHLIITKQNDFSLSEPEGFFFYKFPGGLTRSFKGSNIREHKNLLAFVLPEEVVEIQRRRFPRIIAAGNSRAAFAMAEKQRLRYCTLLDVSLEGAKLRGEVSNLQPGQILRPFTLILGMRHSDLEETIAVTEAKIVWLSVISPPEGFIGVHFKKGTANRDLLEHYIRMRLLEGGKYVA